MKQVTQLQPEQRYIQVGAGTMYYQVMGTGKPVVLVHGLSGSTRWWQQNAGPLAKHFRLYMVDLIGFGRSRAGQKFNLVAAPLTLKEWLDSLSLQQASFIGHSMGGLIVAHLAADYPDMVERLVLVDAVALPMGHSLARQAWNMLQAFRAMPSDLLRVILADAYRAGFINVLAIGQGLLDQDVSLKLARISAPTLVIWGGQDRIVPLRLGRQLNVYLPNSRFVTIEGAGHLPMWEGAVAFNRIVIDFLRDPTPGR